ncbi:DUF1963 domain-containing protein [Enterovibrio calviensis]|uniref:DUF1963 domain-containing protein n=1 Tax=Enterovibrio calviensis TaxID=91359 RepID=UPI0004827765|nr:DUF1963 domain-containing protein [Enterovibrio calviensis]
MPLKSNLKFEQVKKPIAEPISKFGGQPNWISKPEWPLDSCEDKQMQFVGQIELKDKLFGDTFGKMAYIFIDCDEEGQGSWEPDAGLNAVIVQPGDNKIKTVARATGPACPVNHFPIDCEVDQEGLIEFKVLFDYIEEPEYLNDEQIGLMIDNDEDAYDAYAEEMEPSKIGGNPFFIQSEEIPIASDWKFLCQLNEGELPIWVNFGTGVAYAFIDEKGTFGKLLWQC